jgi:archaellum component FlaG (FlaF/FlaG flagellin family)
LSKKGSSSNNHITLSENGEIINDPAKVSEVFNDFFINVAKNIGNTKSGLTCAVLSLSGKTDTSIHLLIKNVIGSTIQGIDSFSNFGDIPS